MDLYRKVKIKNLIKKVIERKYHISISNLKRKDRYYIIHRKTPWAGFFANYLFVLGQIEYAKKKKYIPVVDMENYPSLYNEEAEIFGTKNGWEYYFEQPEGIKLSDAYKSHNYILGDSSNYYECLPYVEADNYFEIFSEKIPHVVKDLCSLVPIKKNIYDQIKKIELELLVGNVLGVHVRGTDKRKNVKDHHVAPIIESYFVIIDRILKKEKIDSILLCCDEKETVVQFKKRYGSMVHQTESYRADSDSNKGIHLEKNNIRENHKYLLGVEVLQDCYLLSKCQYLVYSHSNVTNTAIIWNNNNYIDSFFVESDLYK